MTSLLAERWTGVFGLSLWLLSLSSFDVGAALQLRQGARKARGNCTVARPNGSTIVAEVRLHRYCLVAFGTSCEDSQRVLLKNNRWSWYDQVLSLIIVANEKRHSHYSHTYIHIYIYEQQHYRIFTRRDREMHTPSHRIHNNERKVNTSRMECMLLPLLDKSMICVCLCACRLEQCGHHMGLIAVPISGSTLFSSTGNIHIIG